MGKVRAALLQGNGGELFATLKRKLMDSRVCKTHTEVRLASFA